MKTKSLQFGKAMSAALFVLLLVVVGMKNALAQTQVATLQHGEEISVFYGNNAFVQAHNVAVDGDIVTLDIGACYKGYHGDSAWTYKVGKVSKDVELLLKHTEEAFFEGLKEVKPGNRIGDIGYAISEYAKKYNLGVVKELVGHGIGNHVHEDPDVPNYGKKGTGPLLKEGMCIAVEPMLNMGTADIYMLDDEWTIITADGLPSAHFEHTVVVTKDGYTILTKR